METEDIKGLLYDKEFERDDNNRPMVIEAAKWLRTPAEARQKSEESEIQKVRLQGVLDINAVGQ
jgi:hypothetical protein